MVELSPELRARVDAVKSRRSGRSGEPSYATRRTLTPRRVEVLGLVADGNTNREIADKLLISAETVKTHIRNILLALDARCREHAIAIAFREGLLR